MDDSTQSSQLQPEMARAEELLDQMGQTIGRFTAQVGLEIMKGVALAREEAEDILAEARALNERPRS